MISSVSRNRFHVLLLAIGFAVFGCRVQPSTGGNYPPVTASRIEGTWRIRAGMIEFTTSIAGSDEKVRTCSFPIYSTGVIRIETPAAQYVS